MITPSHEYSRQGRVFVPSSRTSSWIPCTRNGRRTHPEAENPGCCHRVVTAVSRREPRCSGRARRDPFAGSSDAPREIRTPTVQTDHKALNLAQSLPVRSCRRRSAHCIQDDGRSGPGGQCVRCHGVLTGQRSGSVVWPVSVTSRGVTCRHALRVIRGGLAPPRRERPRRARRCRMARSGGGR
jgi:hypothetical protein